jgi:hypothetical protein
VVLARSTSRATSASSAVFAAPCRSFARPEALGIDKTVYAFDVRRFCPKGSDGGPIGVGYYKEKDARRASPVVEAVRHRQGRRPDLQDAEAPCRSLDGSRSGALMRPS